MKGLGEPLGEEVERWSFLAALGGPGGLQHSSEALQGNLFWKQPQEMHKAVRTADLQPINLSRHITEEMSGVGPKAALGTHGRLRNPVGLVVGAGLRTAHPLSQLPQTYSPALIMAINQPATNLSALPCA